MAVSPADLDVVGWIKVGERIAEVLERGGVDAAAEKEGDVDAAGCGRNVEQDELGAVQDPCSSTVIVAAAATCA